jgi:hypothetical protein
VKKAGNTMGPWCVSCFRFIFFHSLCIRAPYSHPDTTIHVSRLNSLPQLFAYPPDSNTYPTYLCFPSYPLQAVGSMRI